VSARASIHAFVLRLARGVLAAALLLAAGASGPLARAEEAGAPPLTRLTAEERASLERRIPGLAGLAPEKQAQIVRNVERLRGLDPEQRKLVERRFKAAREAGLGGQDLAARGESWRQLGKGQQTLAEWQGKALKALGWKAWRELPAALREHPAVAPLLLREWSPVFHQRFLAKAVAGLDAETAKAWQPPTALPEAWRERFAKERETLLRPISRGPGVAGERALLQLKRLVLQGRALESVRAAFSAPVTGVDTPTARLALLGESLAALDAPAYAATVAELVAHAERQGPEAFAVHVRELAQPEKLAPEQQKKLEALQLVFALESRRSWLAAHPKLVPHADSLLRAALVDDLGMPAPTFEQLPARDAPGEARANALRAWFDETLPRELKRHGFARRPFGERGPQGLGEGRKEAEAPKRRREGQPPKLPEPPKKPDSPALPEQPKDGQEPK